MLKVLFLGVAILFNISSKGTKKEFISTDKTICRVTCTITVPDGFGGYVGISASGGNIFTNCETARDIACRRASRRAFNIINQ